MATVGMIANASTQSFLWGNLLDKYRKPVDFVAVGEFLAGIGHLFMVAGYTHFLVLGQQIVAGYVIIFALGIIEIFWSMSNVGWSALVSELTEIDERKQLMGQFSVIGAFGGIGGAILGGVLYDSGGFADGSIFLLAAAVMVFSSFIIYFSIRFRDEVKISESGYTEEERYSLRDLPSQLRKTFLIFILSLIFINFGRNSIATIAPLFLADPTGFNANGLDVALFSNVRSVANIIAGLLIGSVVAKSDDNKVMMAGILFSTVGILWLAVAPTFTLVLIASFLRGIAEVVIGASSYSIVARMAPKEYRGRLFAYYNTTFFLSWGIAGTLVAGPIADILISQGFSNANAYRGSFIAAIVLVVIGVVILLASIRYSRKFEIPGEDEPELDLKV